MSSINFHVLETEILMAMAAASVPGVALGILHKYQLIYARGFGSTSVEDGRIPVTPQTLFRIGSITKCLTGTAAMRLVDIGQLSLDSPVHNYVPELRKFESPDETTITVRMLMNHTAGLPTEVNDHGPRNSDALSRRVRNEIPYYPLLFPAGRFWSYSNPGIDVLGYIIATELGTSFSVAMDQTLFDPLEMVRTTFDPMVAMTYPLALSHDLDEAGILKVRHHFAENTAEHPDGFAMSTVIDLANFAIMHMQGGRYKDRQILTVEAVTQMHQPTIDLYLTQGTAYGLTFFTDIYKGNRRVWHEGSMDRFGSKLVMVPSTGTAVILLCNRATDFWCTASQIVDRICDQLLELPEDSKNTIEGAPEAMLSDECVGDYRGVTRGIVSLRIEEDRLVLIWKTQRIPLMYLRPDLYCGHDTSGEPFSVGIIGEADGSVKYIVLNGDPCERVADISETEPERWSAYQGVYASRDPSSTHQIIIKVTGGRMSLSTNVDEVTLPCIPWGLTRFRCRLGELQFQADEDGIVRLLRVGTKLVFGKIES